MHRLSLFSIKMFKCFTYPFVIYLNNMEYASLKMQFSKLKIQMA